MNRIRLITFQFLLIVFLSSCEERNKSGNKVYMDPAQVDRVEISRLPVPPDTGIYPEKALTSDQKIIFARNWNKSDIAGPRKFFPAYLLTVFLKGGEIREFRTSGKMIKEKDDHCYSLGNENYFSDIYLNAALTEHIRKRK
jgi:hypothetical protein